MDDYANAQDAMSQYGAGGYELGRGWYSAGKKIDAKKFGAEVANDWAMALFNKDLEQQQWERNNAYNDPLAQYQRLINAGMNPLTAMQSIAGVGSATSDNAGDVHGMASAKTGAGSEQASVASMGNAISAAQTMSQSMKNLADARLAKSQTDLMPDQFHSVQDLQAAQSYLMKQQGDVVKALADADVSAKQSAAKLNEVQSWVQRQLEHVYRQQWQYQQKELHWFETDRMRDYMVAVSQCNETMARIKSHLAQAGLFNAQANIQPALARFYNSAAGKADAEAIGQIINNKFEQFGLPRNILGGLLVTNMDAKGLFDQMGHWKNGVRFNVEDDWYKTYMQLGQFDFNQYSNNTTLGRKIIDNTVSQTRLNDATTGLRKVQSFESGSRTASNYFNMFNPLR